MGTSENNGKTFLLYLLARSIVNLRNLVRNFARLMLLGALVLGGYWSVRLAWADALFRRDTEASVREAARLVPSSAEYHSQLAAILDGSGDGGAEDELRKAVAASPRMASAWVELGLRAENSGAVQEAESELVRAARNDRRYSTLWTLANFYFRHNQSGKFWPVARRALLVGDVAAYDPAPLFGLCWKLSRDPDTILKRAIPDVGAVQARYLEFLVRENLVPAADAVAERVVAMGGERDLNAVYEYCDRLIAEGDAERAIHAWNALCWRTLRGYQPLAPDTGVSLTNGNFSAAPVEHGFDWRMAAAEGVTVERAGSPPRLWITLDGHEPEACDPAAQVLPVAPGQRYRLRFRYQTDGLAAASGVRWRLTDVAGHAELESDAADLASEQNAAATVHFRVPADVRLVRLVLAYRRTSGTVRIEGRVAVSDLVLEFDR
jgi:tetratricopeptide (TPR) repeat protein